MREIVTYVKLEGLTLAQAFTMQEESPLFVNGDDDGQLIYSDSGLFDAVKTGRPVYRRVVTVIDPMQQARDAAAMTNDIEVDELRKVMHKFAHVKNSKMFDAELVRCARIIVEAYDL